MRPLQQPPTGRLMRINKDSFKEKQPSTQKFRGAKLLRRRHLGFMIFDNIYVSLLMNGLVYLSEPSSPDSKLFI